MRQWLSHPNPWVRGVRMAFLAWAVFVVTYVVWTWVTS
jgi:hypothetical protein